MALLYTVGWNGYNPQSLPAGTYFYTILDGNNCLFSNSINITSPATPIVALDSVTNVTCYNYMNGTATLNISGGIPPYTESWLNSNPNLLGEGFHVFEILDNNNCLFTDSVYISQPTQISAAVQTVDVICNALSTGSAALYKLTAELLLIITCGVMQIQTTYQIIYQQEAIYFIFLTLMDVNFKV